MAGLLTGCGSMPPSFDSPEPGARNAAIVRAVAREDTAAVPDLVRMLDSDDPATRVLAIQALERLTGERLGYDPVESPAERARGVERWRARVNDFKPGAARQIPTIRHD